MYLFFLFLPPLEKKQLFKKGMELLGETAPLLADQLMKDFHRNALIVSFQGNILVLILGR